MPYLTASDDTSDEDARTKKLVFIDYNFHIFNSSLGGKKYSL